jgi:hypothetical protein
MIAARIAHRRTPADVRLDLPIEATIHVPLDRRRIAMQTLVGLVVTLLTTTWLILMALGSVQGDSWQVMLPVHQSNGWQLAGTCIALAGAISAALRGMRRLQDPEPGLVVGPRGLRVRSGESTLQSETIPWSAIRAVETRGQRGRPYIALQLREPQRYAPPASVFNWPGRRLRGDALAISPQFLRIGLPDLEALLRRYFEHYSSTSRRS